MSAVADKLREARALIERGWMQGVYVCDGPNGRYFCVYGAINAVVTGDPNNDCDDRTEECESLVADAIGYDRLLLSEFNDQPGRKKSEVLAAFDRAIEIAERGETL